MLVNVKYVFRSAFQLVTHFSCSYDYDVFVAMFRTVQYTFGCDYMIRRTVTGLACNRYLAAGLYNKVWRFLAIYSEIHALI